MQLYVHIKVQGVLKQIMEDQTQSRNWGENWRNLVQKVLILQGTWKGGGSESSILKYFV